MRHSRLHDLHRVRGRARQHSADCDHEDRSQHGFDVRALPYAQTGPTRMDLDFATVFKKSGPWQYNHDQSRVCADEEQALPRLLRLSVLRFSQTHPFSNTLHKQPFRPSPPPPHPPPSLDGREGIAASRAFKEGEDHSGSRSSSPYQIDGEKATKIKRSSGECVSHHPPHPRPPTPHCAQQPVHTLPFWASVGGGDGVVGGRDR